MSDSIIVGEFNDSYKPIMDGVGVCVENYTRWISAKHGTGVAIVPYQPRVHDDDEFDVVRFPSLPFVLMSPYRVGAPWLDPGLGKRLRSYGFNIVHSHTPFVAGRMARRLARRMNVPHVSTFHTKYRDDALKILRSERLADEVVRRIVSFYTTVDAVWTPSPLTAETLREYGFDGPVSVAPNGSDMSIPTSEENERLSRRGAEISGVGPDEFMFLFVGQHRWEKNVELIFRAVATLEKLVEGESDRAFRLVLAGEGNDAREMKAFCRKLGILSRTTFLGKIVDRSALKSLFARADLFVFPSLYDMAPLVMREAAAFSVPTMVAAGSTIAEIVRDGENGFVTENDPEMMARRLRLLMGQAELIRRAGDGARRTIYRSWESIVDWVATQYRELIEGFV